MKIDWNSIALLALLLGAGGGVTSLRADDAPAAANAPAAPTPPAPQFHLGPSLNPGVRPLSAVPASPAPPAAPPAAIPTPLSPSAVPPAGPPLTISVAPLSIAPSLNLRPPLFGPAGSPAHATHSAAAPPVGFPYLAPPGPAPAPSAEAPRLVAAPMAPPATPLAVDSGNAQNYHIHIGDVLSVTMTDENDFATRALVENNGTISLPYIKEVKVAGKTLDEATADITQRLSKFYINPAITVAIAQYRSKQFVILGQVNAPGVYSFAPDQDSMTLMEAIAKASGVTQSGDLGHVTVKRIVDGKEEVIPVNARDARALSRNQEGPAFPILPGDSIVITLFRNEINLLGQVRRPGIYTLPPLLDTIDLIEAIALAGGTTDEKDLGIVHIKRVIDGKETSLSIDAKDIGRDKAGANFPLYAGDTVIVEVVDNDFIVLGQVNRPGSYQIPPFHDSVDLIEAIAMAGGATRLADTSHVTIKRTVNGKTVVIKANAQKLARSDDDEHVDVLPGDRIVISERIF